MTLAVRSMVLVVGALCALVCIGLPSGAAAESCAPVVNPYDGTRYEGVDLSHIQARAVGCRKARRVARRAHSKALGLVPPPSGIRRFNWNGWSVVGNLRPDSDRYVAKRKGKRVAWRF